MTQPVLASMVRVVFVAALAAVATAGCGGNSSSGGVADTTPGLVIGPPDDHCLAGDGGLIVQSIGACDVASASLVPSNAASCSVQFTAGAGPGGDADGGVSAGDDYGPTMYGAAGNDDDCKYYLSWTATPIKVGTDTFFTVTATRLADMMPATCAGISPDVSLNLQVGVPTPPHPSTEIAPGVYKVGPIKFTQAGIWTVRFHLFEECGDSNEDSPHGHAAFFVQVP